ncbi:MAG: hypothetical protein U1F77_10375 [Kiritimatiellia bacterium]
MRRWFLSFLFVLASLPAPAELKVWCVMKEKVFLQYEAIPAEVHVLNEGAEPVALSTNAPSAVLRVEVKDGERKIVPSTGKPLLLRPVEIAPGQTVRLPLDLSALYSIASTSPHSVSAAVDFDGMTYESLSTRFDVQRGAEVARTTSKAPRRVFSLRTLVRADRQMLFVRVDDPAAGVCYGSYELERFQKFMAPRTLFDARGNLHVLFSHVPGALIHAEIAPNGVPLSRKYYREGQKTPQFGPNDRGEIMVSGALPMPAPD